jgi:hypothetical protein
MLRRLFFFVPLGLAGVTLPVGPAGAQGTPEPPKRKPDLGDAAQGRYSGDVISDSKGSSQSGVNLTVTRVGKNLVRITSDYPRLPVVEVSLTLAMGKIIQARGNTPFVLDRARSPAALDVSFNNEVSWAGVRQ